MKVSLELLAEAGLVVKEQGIDMQLARDFSLECAKLVVSKSILPLESGTSSWGNEPATVQYYVYPAKLFVGTTFTAIKQILDLNPYRDDPKATIAVNRQMPHSMQRFHSDFSIDKQVVVHGNDGGLFDFSLSDDPNDYHTVKVGAGYVVEQNNPVLLHRGRNPSDFDRYSAVLGVEDPTPFF